MSIYAPPVVVKDDPAIRADGSCAHCSGPRVTTRSKAVDGNQTPNAVWLSHVEKDPFCTSECCRAFHGCELDPARLAA